MNECIPLTLGWCESTWLVIDHLGTLLGITAVPGIIIALFFWFRRYKIFNRLAVQLRTLASPLPAAVDVPLDDWKWDGLVFTVSQPYLPNWVIQTRKDTLKGIALIATEVSYDVAQEIKQQAKELNIKHVSIHLIHDPNDINTIEDLTRDAIKNLQDKDIGNIAIDITGGNVPMSMGAYKAAVSNNLDTLYIASERDKHGDPIQSTVRQICLAPISNTQSPS